MKLLTLSVQHFLFFMSGLYFPTRLLNFFSKHSRLIIYQKKNKNSRFSISTSTYKYKKK